MRPQGGSLSFFWIQSGSCETEASTAYPRTKIPSIDGTTPKKYHYAYQVYRAKNN